MKNFLLTLSTLLALQSFAINEINAIIGDASSARITEKVSIENIDEQTRIHLHLKYVESRLRAESTEHLSENTAQNRADVLNLLQYYTNRNTFPTLPKPFDSRQPCFIDDRGIPCAVAYLISATAGSEVAAQINSQHRFEYILDMNEPIIEKWAQEYGFTLYELAMIQPTYSYIKTPIVEPIEPIDLELPRIMVLEGQIRTLKDRNTGLQKELEDAKNTIDEMNSLLDEKEQIILETRAELSEEQEKNILLQEEQEVLNKKVIKKKRWNIALAGVATSLTSITVFQWIKIRKSE